MKGEYKLIYTTDDVLSELVVLVELKPISGLLKPFQNVYYGVVHVNGELYNKKDLNHCVDAKLAVEEIGLELKDDLKKRLRKEGKSFRFKKEEIL